MVKYNYNNKTTLAGRTSDQARAATSCPTNGRARATVYTIINVCAAKKVYTRFLRFAGIAEERGKLICTLGAVPGNKG